MRCPPSVCALGAPAPSAAECLTCPSIGPLPLPPQWPFRAVSGGLPGHSRTFGARPVWAPFLFRHLLSGGLTLVQKNDAEPHLLHGFSHQLRFYAYRTL